MYTNSPVPSLKVAVVVFRDRPAVRVDGLPGVQVREEVMWLPAAILVRNGRLIS